MLLFLKLQILTMLIACHLKLQADFFTLILVLIMQRIPFLSFFLKLIRDPFPYPLHWLYVLFQMHWITVPPYFKFVQTVLVICWFGTIHKHPNSSIKHRSWIQLNCSVANCSTEDVFPVFWSVDDDFPIKPCLCEILTQTEGTLKKWGGSRQDWTN